MHRSRTTLALATLALAVAACGNQSQGTATNAVGHGGAATTSAAATSTAAPGKPATTAPATATDATPEASSAAPTSLAAATKSADAAPSATEAATAPAASDDTIFHANPASAARPHFRSPEAAMRYLAAAWNADDITALKHVTEPTARMLLLGMKHEAVNLKLDNCEKRDGGNGDYLCHFTHDYPTAYPKKLREGVHGSSEFIAAPSSSVGWYMFQYEGCG